MLRQGPVPAFVHGVVEYIVGAALIALPLVLRFESDAAMAVSIVTGVFTLLLGATSALPTGLVKYVPVQAHAVIDFAVGAFLIAAPFLFGFTDETTPTAIFIVVGVLGLLMTVATRFLGPREAGAA